MGEVHRRECVTAASQRRAERQNLMGLTNTRKLQISREFKVFFRGAEGDEFLSTALTSQGSLVRSQSFGHGHSASQIDRNLGCHNYVTARGFPWRQSASEELVASPNRLRVGPGPAARSFPAHRSHQQRRCQNQRAIRASVAHTATVA
jgi:hypothetical protein